MSGGYQHPPPAGYSTNEYAEALQGEMAQPYPPATTFGYHNGGSNWTSQHGLAIQGTGLPFQDMQCYPAANDVPGHSVSFQRGQPIVGHGTASDSPTMESDGWSSVSAHQGSASSSPPMYSDEPRDPGGAIWASDPSGQLSGQLGRPSESKRKNKGPSEGGGNRGGQDKRSSKIRNARDREGLNNWLREPDSLYDGGRAVPDMSILAGLPASQAPTPFHYSSQIDDECLYDDLTITLPPERTSDDSERIGTAQTGSRIAEGDAFQAGVGQTARAGKKSSSKPSKQRKEKGI